MRKNAKNNKKGFTLIELIVVVAILVALMLMLVPKLTGFTNDATKTANQANARAIYTAIKASETARTTGLYADDKDPNVELCGKKVFVAFWEDGNLAGCSVTEDADKGVTSVTYPNATDANRGTYPSAD